MLPSVIMLSVIDTPIVVRTSNSVTVMDEHDLEVRHQPTETRLLSIFAIKITILLRVTHR